MDWFTLEMLVGLMTGLVLGVLIGWYFARGANLVEIENAYTQGLMKGVAPAEDETTHPSRYWREPNG